MQHRVGAGGQRFRHVEVGKAEYSIDAKEAPNKRRVLASDRIEFELESFIVLEHGHFHVH